MKKKKLPYSHKSGFSVPDNYFENFKITISSGYNTKQASSFLPKKQQNFKVPKNYFEEFKVDLPKESKKTTKVISIFQSTTLWRVASIAAIFIVSFLLFKNHERTQVSYNDLNHAAIENYIDNTEIDFYTQDLFYSFDNNTEDIKKELNSIDRETILDYLTENEEITSLLNE